MCGASMILTTLLSAAKTFADFSQQSAIAREQQRQQQQRAIDLRRQSAHANASRVAELGRERAAASLKIQREREAGLKARERGRVAAGEAGFNFAPLERDLGGDAAGAREDTRRQHADLAHETALRNESETLGLQSRLNAFPRVRRPDAASSALDFASGLLGQLESRLPKF